jgi:signal transduction histidine kinase
MDVAKQQLGDIGELTVAAAAVTRAQGQLADAIRALRELTTGIYPRPLIEDGVAAALEELCERSPVPVVLDVEPARWPRPVEDAAYFLIAEALTNVYRHAQASKVCVTVRETDGLLVVTVADDGVGGVGCHPRGLEERAAAIGGQLLVDSPVGAGTTLQAILPLSGSR